LTTDFTEDTDRRRRDQSVRNPEAVLSVSSVLLLVEMCFLEEISEGPIATNNTNSHEQGHKGTPFLFRRETKSFDQELRSAFVSVRVVRGLGLWVLILAVGATLGLRWVEAEGGTPEASLGDPWLTLFSSFASFRVFRG